MKYPIGIQNFEIIRKNGYVYVDKTDLVYKLAQGHICFLARPRRLHRGDTRLRVKTWMHRPSSWS